MKCSIFLSFFLSFFNLFCIFYYLSLSISPLLPLLPLISYHFPFHSIHTFHFPSSPLSLILPLTIAAFNTPHFPSHSSFTFPSHTLFFTLSPLSAFNNPVSPHFYPLKPSNHTHTHILTPHPYPSLPLTHFPSLPLISPH